jgi:hypothetical protein
VVDRDVNRIFWLDPGAPGRVYVYLSSEDAAGAVGQFSRYGILFAEFERAMLRERTKAGLEAARRDGRIGGRRPKLSPQQQTEIVRMISRGRKTAADAARLFGVHPATVSRLMRARTTARGPLP